MHPATVMVSLCLYSETLDPSDISARLGWAPTRSRERNVPISARGKPRPECYWSLETEGLAADIERLLGRLLTLMEERRSVLEQLSSDWLIRLGIGFETYTNRFCDMRRLIAVSR